jgi:DNA polymerase III subunit delta
MFLLYILWGEDAFSQEEKLREIKAGLGDASMLATNLHYLQGEKLSVQELGGIGQAMPFLSPRRVIIIKGLLQRFESRERSAPARKNGQESAGELGEMAACLKGLPESTIVALVDTPEEPRKNPLKNNPLYKLLADQADTIYFPALNPRQLFQWVQDRAAARGGSISRQASDVLLELVGSDLFTLNNEIEKLTTFATGRMIEEKDVHSLVAAAQERNVFNLVDAMMDNQAGRAEQILEDLLKHGQTAQAIIGALARQVQSLLIIREMKAQRRPSAEIQSRTGIISPYAFSKVSARAAKFNLAKLKEIYRKLLEADLSIKTGKTEGDLAMVTLVAELSKG